MMQGTIRRPPFRVDSAPTCTRNDRTIFVERDNLSLFCSREGLDSIDMHADQALKHPNGAYSGIHRHHLTTSAGNGAPESEDQTHSPCERSTLDELWEEEKQLESARQIDMESDLSHVFALKTIVANFMLSLKSLGKSVIPKHSSQVASVNSGLRPSLARCSPVENIGKVTPIVVSSTGPEVDAGGLSGSIEAAGMNIENSTEESARSKAGILADVLIQASTPRLLGQFPWALPQKLRYWKVSIKLPIDESCPSLRTYFEVRRELSIHAVPHNNSLGGVERRSDLHRTMCPTRKRGCLHLHAVHTMIISSLYRF